MTLKDRAISAYEAKREAERSEAEQSARRDRENREIALQNLCRDILDAEQLDLPIQWLMAYNGEPGDMGFLIPVCEIDGLLFTCWDESTERSGKMVLGLIAFPNKRYTCSRVWNMESLGNLLVMNGFNPGRIQGNDIIPA